MEPLEEWLGSLKLREFLPLFEENHIDLQCQRRFETDPLFLRSATSI